MRDLRILVASVVCSTLAILSGCEGHPEGYNDDHVRPRHIEAATNMCTPNGGLKMIRWATERTISKRASVGFTCTNGMDGAIELPPLKEVK